MWLFVYKGIGKLEYTDMQLYKSVQLDKVPHVRTKVHQLNTKCSKLSHLMFRMFALREKERVENQELKEHYNYYKIFNYYNKLSVLYNIVYHVLMIYILWFIPNCYISVG